MVNHIIIVSICVSFLLYFIPIWWVLWRTGWRKYLRIQNYVTGNGLEIVSALFLAFGLLLAVPDPTIWIIKAIVELVVDAETGIFGAAPRPLFGYLYPAGLAVFPGYLWVNRRRKRGEVIKP